MKVFSLLSLGLVPIVHSHAIPRTNSRDYQRTLYFLDNNPVGSNIVALPIDGESGTLGAPVKTSTGGYGLVGNNMMGPAMADSLFSQDSVVVSESDLFTVNAGSNTLAYFHIRSSDPLHPELRGSPASTGGDFPNTVAYSPKNRIACVANTGPRAGVQCFHVSRRKGLTPLGGLRPLPITQSLPPLGPAGTASDMLFNPSETALFVTIKGDGTNPGYIYVFPVEGGKVSEKPIISRPPELLIPFGASFVSETTAIVTDPTFGASYVSVANNWTVAVSRRIALENQTASCWVATSRAYDAAYILDAGNSTVVTLQRQSGDVRFAIEGPQGGTGGFDGVASGQWLYVLQAQPQIAVFDLQGSKDGKKVPNLIQTLDLTALGNRATWIGLAAWPN